MRVSLAVTLFAVACTGGTQPGDPCSADQHCDGGQVCDLTAPGGPACLAASGDVDGDGIANDKDFCEHMPGGAYDEDADGIGDECDPCPIARPPTSAETDGDGVDGPCDPDPRTPGDKIVLFNGFNAPLTGLPSSWKIQGGEAIMTPATTGIVELTLPLPLPSSHVAILASYRIDRVDGAAVSHAGVMGLNELPMGKTVLRCGSLRTGGDQLRLETNNGVNTRIAMDLFNPAGLYRLGENIDGGSVSCAVLGDKDAEALTGSSTGEAMNQIGLYAASATVRFQYILAIAR